MTTNAERLTIYRSWQRWHVADEDVRAAEETGQHAQAAERRAARDEISGDPLRALYAARELIEALTAERWDMITDARLRGVSWEEIAAGVRQPTNTVREEYTDLVNCMHKQPPADISPGILDRYRAAL